MTDLDEIAAELRSRGQLALAERVRYAGMERDALVTKLDKAERRARQFEGWWAGLTVDSERKIREASARALDCADHGRIIRELESQVGSLSEQYHEADKRRGRYGVFLLQLQESLEKLDASRVTTAQLVTTLAKEIKRVLR